MKTLQEYCYVRKHVKAHSYIYIFKKSCLDKENVWIDTFACTHTHKGNREDFYLLDRKQDMRKQEDTWFCKLLSLFPQWLWHHIKRRKEKQPCDGRKPQLPVPMGDDKRHKDCVSWGQCKSECITPCLESFCDFWGQKYSSLQQAPRIPDGPAWPGSLGSVSHHTLARPLLLLVHWKTSVRVCTWIIKYIYTLLPQKQEIPRHVLPT